MLTDTFTITVEWLCISKLQISLNQNVENFIIMKCKVITHQKGTVLCAVIKNNSLQKIMQNWEIPQTRPDEFNLNRPVCSPCSQEILNTWSSQQKECCDIRMSIPRKVLKLKHSQVHFDAEAYKSRIYGLWQWTVDQYTADRKTHFWKCYLTLTFEPMTLKMSSGSCVPSNY